jgi:hypothetical protein
MNVRRHTYAVILSLSVPILGASSSYAAPHNGAGGSSSTALPCVMTDFVGGAPYPQGMGPVTEIAYPNTGEAVTGRVYVQQGSYSGIWVGDPMVGGITKIELYVDRSLVSTTDLMARKSSPLVWSTSGAAKGTHELQIRAFSTNFDRTKVCYVDSAYEYPSVL